MGIPLFFYTIYKKYNGENTLIIDETELSKHNIEHLFFDYNSLVHPVCQSVLYMYSDDQTITKQELEELIIKHTLDYTKYVITCVNPNNIWFYLDGIAPRAKINQQRERRYKSYFLRNVYSEYEKHPKLKWDTNKITPGTAFMEKLTQRLHKFAKYYINLGKTVNISSSDIPGEGEHKMVKVISELNLVNDNKITIYGLDADLIMLSLLNKNRDNIILIRDSSSNKSDKKSGSDKHESFTNTFSYLDISKLTFSIHKEVCIRSKLQLSVTSVIQDYVFICFFLGNDFLDHIPNVSLKNDGLNFLINSYCKILVKYKNFLIEKESSQKRPIGNWTQSINLLFLRSLISYISNNESNSSNFVSKKSGYRDVYDLDKISELTLGQVSVYKNDYIKYEEPRYKKRYYNYYNVSENEIDELCKNYLTGMFWTFGYYDYHIHENWNWYYKYDCSPFASDLLDYLNKQIFNTIDNKINKSVLKNPELGLIDKIKKSAPNTYVQQLMFVLPRESLLEILKENYDKVYKKLYRYFSESNVSCSSINENDNKLTNNSGIVSEIDRAFPKSISIDMFGKDYLWQSKVFFPKFDENILQLLV